MSEAKRWAALSAAIALGIGMSACGEKREGEPIKDADRVATIDGNQALVRYYTDGTRHVTEYDKDGDVTNLFIEKCKGKLLNIAIYWPEVPLPGTLDDYTYGATVIPLTESGPCKNESVDPSDFSGRESSLE